MPGCNPIISDSVGPPIINFRRLSALPKAGPKKPQSLPRYKNESFVSFNRRSTSNSPANQR
jgi:hypothetical protein